MSLRKSRLQSRIEKALKPLVGLPLSDMWRAGCQIFEFGQQHPFQNRKGEQVIRADYGLDVSCPWRIIAPEGMALASWDYLSDDKRTRPRHARSRAFFEQLRAATLTVEAIEADSVGGVRFRLKGGYVLEVLPVSTSRSDEYWRMVTLQEEARHHFVVTGGGVQASRARLLAEQGIAPDAKADHLPPGESSDD